jgi:exonuclease SbcD
MGHLFTTGGKTVDGDGVRKLHVGSLAHVDKDVFPAYIDYLALGHLHIPQKLGTAEHLRYSGSPIPMGYGEAYQEKSVVIIEFSNDPQPEITLYPVPCFQALERISGGIDEITEKIHELKSKGSNAWLEIEYTGTEIAGNLQELIDVSIANTAMESLRIKNKRVVERIISRTCKDETLDDLDVNDVFIRCLDTYEVLEDERPALIQSYKETIQGMQEEDLNA